MENDRIEREIFIAAPLQKVWSLVSQPGWFLGGESGPDRVQLDGNRAVAETRYGDFPVLMERIEPPTYIACRCAFPGEEPRAENCTLIEFTLTPEAGGTRLRVVESGFSKLTVREGTPRVTLEGNTKGWEQQLDALRRRAEQLVG